MPLKCIQLLLLSIFQFLAASNSVDWWLDILFINSWVDAKSLTFTPFSFCKLLREQLSNDAVNEAMKN